MKTLSSVFGMRGPSLSNVSSMTCVSSEFCLKWWCTHHDNAFYWLNRSSLHDYGIQLYHENSADATLSPFTFFSGIWFVVQTRWSHPHRRGLETVCGLSLLPLVFVLFLFGVDGFRLDSPWRFLIVDWLTKIVKFFYWLNNPALGDLRWLSSRPSFFISRDSQQFSTCHLNQHHLHCTRPVALSCAIFSHLITAFLLTCFGYR